MPNLDAIYRVIHQPSGHVVDSYDSEASALACVERENEEYPDSHVVVKYVRADLAQQPAAAVPAEDAIEAAYWDFDARHKGYGPHKTTPQSERDAFKWAVRDMLAAARKGVGNE